VSPSKSGSRCEGADVPHFRISRRQSAARRVHRSGRVGERRNASLLILTRATQRRTARPITSTSSQCFTLTTSSRRKCERRYTHERLVPNSHRPPDKTRRSCLRRVRCAGLNVFRLQIFCRRESRVVGNPIHIAEADATQTRQFRRVWRGGVN